MPADLTAQLQRQKEQADREIAQLRETLAATEAALRDLKGRGKGEETPHAPSSRARSKRSA